MFLNSGGSKWRPQSKRVIRLNWKYLSRSHFLEQDCYKCINNVLVCFGNTALNFILELLFCFHTFKTKQNKERGKYFAMARNAFSMPLKLIAINQQTHICGSVRFSFAVFLSNTELHFLKLCFPQKLK